MSYESKKLEELAMPTRKEVENVLLQTLFRHGGVIKEFGAGQEIVNEMADKFELDDSQRAAFLETVYRKQNRRKKAFLWHRLLFRAADGLAQEKLLSRPTQTFQLTGRREWMLTERGFDAALRLYDMPVAMKDSLPVKSYEVQQVVNELVESPKPENYDPVDRNKKIVRITRKSALRGRGFRQAVIEAYDCKCAVCGLKVKSPDSLTWEVEAAHIVPNRALGRDDLWNGIALCRFHHWALDVGWFTLLENYRIQASSEIQRLSSQFGRMGDYEILRSLANENARVFLPARNEIRPDRNAILWHRENVFEKQTINR
jgi:putative restriction endonuclease